MLLDVKEIPGKVLIAYKKGTEEIVGEAHRVNVDTGDKRRERWIVKEGDAMTGVLPTWDAAAKVFRDKGHTVKAVDSSTLTPAKPKTRQAAPERRSFAKRGAKTPKSEANAAH